MTHDTTIVIGCLIVFITAALLAVAVLVDRTSYTAGFQDGVADERARQQQDRAVSARSVRRVPHCSVDGRDPRTPAQMMKDVRS